MERVILKKVLTVVENDDVETLKELIDGEDSYSASRILCYAAEVNAINVIKWLLSDENIMPHLQNNYAIRIAHEKGNEEIEKLLASDKRVDVKVLDDKNLKIKSKVIKIEDNCSQLIDEFKKKFDKLSEEKVEDGLENVMVINSSSCSRVEKSGKINFTNTYGEYICKEWMEESDEDITYIKAFVDNLITNYSEYILKYIFNDGSDLAIIERDDGMFCYVNYKKLFIVSPNLKSTLGVENKLGVGIDENERTIYVKSDGYYKYYGEKVFNKAVIKSL